MTWLRRLLTVAAVALVVVATAGGSFSSSSGNAATEDGKGTANKVNAKWPKTLTLGQVGQEDSTSLTNSWAPVAKLIKDELGITLKVTTGTSYASMIEAQQSGKAQLVGYGPFSYYIAKNIRHLNISQIGIPIPAENAAPNYHSEEVINPKTNPTLTSIKDLKGKKVCFSDPASTSGYLFPSYGLRKVGIDPTNGVTPVFTGTDTSTAAGVAKGQCDAGFTNDRSLPKGEQQGVVDPSDVKIVWTSPPIPSSPTAVSDSLPASLRSALENLLIKKANSTWLSAHGYCPSEAACTDTTGRWGFLNPKVVNYSVIAKVCHLTKAPTCTKA